MTLKACNVPPALMSPAPGDFTDFPGLALNFIECDILADFPGIYSVARYRYTNGTRYELITCRDCIDQDDMNDALSVIPHPIRMVGVCTGMDTHSCGPEVAYNYWEPRV